MKKTFFNRNFHYYATIVSETMSTNSLYEGGEFMKKIILAVIATSMLLTNVAFASTKTTQTNTAKNKAGYTTQQKGWINLNSTDPH